MCQNKPGGYFTSAVPEILMRGHPKKDLTMTINKEKISKSCTMYSKS